MNWKYILLSLTVLLMWGCKDDLLYSNEPGGSDAEGETVQAFLSLSVNDFTVTTDGTRDSEPSETNEEASEYENRIDNVWVFQYQASDGSMLGKAQYLTITDQNSLEKLPVELVAEVQSYFCVVANTGDDKWLVSRDFSTFSKMKDQTLSSPEPIMFSNYTNPSEAPAIPMEGEVKNVFIKAGSVIKVPVTRMYAKLIITYDSHELNMTPKSIEFNNIPLYCRVGTLAEGHVEGDKVTYKDNPQWITRSYDATSLDKTNPAAKEIGYVVYIPENLQGEKVNENNEEKYKIAPPQALIVRALMNYNYEEQVPDKGYNVYLDEDRQYNLCPGGNTTNNFNIKRNNAYRLKLSIYDATEHTPSANCFVVSPGQNFAFEPYNREEEGGGYFMSTYLNHTVEDKAIGGVHHVQILWQTKDAIGDNSDGSKVWFVKNEDNAYYSRIIVRANKEGNALIGAYNSKNEIIWSWHIWIRNNDPSNVGQAMIYRTYEWDEYGIKHNQAREDGYAVMPCNLGALANEPTSRDFANVARTFGMLYQWGRKDPFPPLIKYLIEVDDYNNVTEKHYDYTNRAQISKTSDTKTPETDPSPNNPKVSFFSFKGSDLTDPIKYSIQNPLVFMVGSNEIKDNITNLAYESNYFNKGDWMPVGKSDNKLWGGEEPSNSLTHLKVNTNPDIYIYKNYGNKKSIFDPCPKGWRVPPGDLWLGFTKTGLNSSSSNPINHNSTKTNQYTYGNNEGGMFMYMRESGSGPTLYFPAQGPRVPSGWGYRVGICGNYHNATVSNDNRVNILHVHNGVGTFATFETGYCYTRKSIGGPIRCVRDTK